MQDAPLETQDTAVDRANAAKKATWISVAVNLALTLAQLLAGWLAHSQSLIAHGLHSLSDLLSDFLVLWASAQSAAPADSAHPYGHARFETAATLLLGISLVGIGGGILWDSGLRLQAGEGGAVVGMLAFWTAVLTVVAKEALYHYLIAVAEKWRSQLLTANALHTRADAASALVVVVGIGGALLGWSFLDLLAAALMGFMILRMGAQLARDAISELIDTGLDAARVEAFRKTLLATPGVRGLHELRSRRMAHQVLIDAHVQVDPRISVSEGHKIAEMARRQVLREHPDVLDVLVHVDPEDDLEPDLMAVRLPARELVMAWLEPVFVARARPCRVVLHYVANRVEIELHYADPALAAAEVLGREVIAVGACLRAHAPQHDWRVNALVALK